MSGKIRGAKVLLLEVPDMLHACLAGLIIGAVGSESPRLVFGVITYWLFSLWNKNRAVKKTAKVAFEKLKESLASDELVVVKAEDLKKYGLEAVDGELGKTDAG